MDPSHYIDITEITEDGLPRKAFYTYPEVMRAVMRLDNPTSAYYFGVCSRKYRSGVKDAVAGTTTLWADYDYKNGGYNPEALRWLSQYPPSANVFTGGGWHAYWYLKAPCYDKVKIEDAVARIAYYLKSDTSVSDSTRVLRLPGTVNAKYGTVVSLQYNDRNRRYSIDSFVESLPEVRQRKTAGDYFTSYTSGSRNDGLFAVALRLFYNHIDTDTVYQMLLVCNTNCCTPPLEDSEVFQIVTKAERYADANRKPLYTPDP